MRKAQPINLQCDRMNVERNWKPRARHPPIKVRSVKHKEEDTIDDTAEPNEAIHLTDTADPTDTIDPTRILEPWRFGFWECIAVIAWVSATCDNLCLVGLRTRILNKITKKQLLGLLLRNTNTTLWGGLSSAVSPFRSG